ncbi:hypothetical protein F5B22DRAFT_483187 [Xylaria bambusicola]|uniref:uncharacterized protein n=1 Tax=Xylaria bambusicola TaxID=326684 RepID=UPI002007E8C6|nr:uncharacterized protein F5B22DRAFT_483187 [Xylaria bambusicola]KAI0506077.1 hypothetical protein F5B22DRAFT_483187 [Xylaria bambusicola]
MVYHDIDIPLPAFIAIDFIGMTVALIPIVLRFWLRWREAKPQPLTRNISDGLIVLSWLSGLVLISINAWKNSLRQRYIHYPPSELYYSVPRPLSAHLLYVSWISLFFIYISLWAAKFALIAFFASVLRLMETRLARLFLGFAVIFTTSTFILHITLLTRWCTPISSNWDINGKLCSAVHDIRSVTVSTVANISTDLVILSLPIFALTSLSRERRALTTERRITKAEWSGFALVISVAALSIIAALARWITLQLVHTVPKANITHTIDVWALVEIVASLLAVCLPTLRSFVRRSRTESRRRMENGQSSKLLFLHWKGSESTVRASSTSV